MNKKISRAELHAITHEIAHYLPAQAPLKDFVHHNTLHAFQHEPFQLGIRKASKMFGYQVTLSLEEYRELYHAGKIHAKVLEQVISRKKPEVPFQTYLNELLYASFPTPDEPRIGKLRFMWKEQAHVDLDSYVQPRLFRVLSSYLDQGIAIWKFPGIQKGFLGSIRELEENSFVSLFKSKRVRAWLLDDQVDLADLLEKIVGDKALYRQYLFDQQFSHQGWSGMVASIELNPATLLDKRRISLEELMVFELLLEADALDDKLGDNWKPLSEWLLVRPKDLFAPIVFTELAEVLSIWQEAYEYTYYDQVLEGILANKPRHSAQKDSFFQALFCIDDRECSVRRYLEKEDPACLTYGTPGFFQVEFFYQPQGGKFYTKLCPAPVTPKYLIKESSSATQHETEAHFTKHSHGLHTGWLITQTVGFWSALRLFLNVFVPKTSPAGASSFKHMDKTAFLTVENRHPTHKEKGLQIGFTIEEMVERVENLLRSIGLIQDFSEIVYVVGHGASSNNNPHYAAYDCGACSGRPGSVNARVICHMANHPQVRNLLRARGIDIPDITVFLGALHDTTRDEIEFFDEQLLNETLLVQHEKNIEKFKKALSNNAKERARRFESVDTNQSLNDIHEEVKLRAVSLFEPRPELNHATNVLCIVGSRELSKGLFLDRRSFLNSYDWKQDKDGAQLLGILKAVAPVCGGINLEYYFSRTDNQKMGAGTKLPHNVMGLFGVANGIDGDLRPGLPAQMIEVHEPKRLLVIIEQMPELVLAVLKSHEPTYEWFKNEWIHLCVLHPQRQEWYRLVEDHFDFYQPASSIQTKPINWSELDLQTSEALPVTLLND